MKFWFRSGFSFLFWTLWFFDVEDSRSLIANIIYTLFSHLYTNTKTFDSIEHTSLYPTRIRSSGTVWCLSGPPLMSFANTTWNCSCIPLHVYYTLKTDPGTTLASMSFVSRHGLVLIVIIDSRRHEQFYSTHTLSDTNTNMISEWPRG